MIYLFVISIISMFSYNYLYFANIMYFLVLFIYGFKHLNKVILTSFVLYAISMALSFALYTYNYGFSGKLLISLIYSLQIIIVAIPLKINKETFIYFYKRMVLIYSFAICCAFVVHNIFDFHPLFFADDRMWGSKLFFGWPNSTGLPLMFGMYLYLKEDTKIKKEIIVILLATLFTTSRSTLLGTILIICYFVYKKNKTDIKKIVYLLCLVLLCILIIRPAMFVRIIYFADRWDIIKDVFSVTKNNIFFGFGGSNLQDIFQLNNRVTIFSHTHNTILEIFSRYGLISLIAFFNFTISFFSTIKKEENKVFVAIMFFISLFQIYIRNAVFLILIGLVYSFDNCVEGDNEKNSYNRS